MIGLHIKANLPKTYTKPTLKGNGGQPVVIGYKELKPEQVIPFHEGELKEF